jgi:hypothetical protein
MAELNNHVLPGALKRTVGSQSGGMTFARSAAVHAIQATMGRFERACIKLSMPGESATTLFLCRMDLEWGRDD